MLTPYANANPLSHSVTIPDISHDTAKILLKKSAASVACHAGYSSKWLYTLLNAFSLKFVQ